MTTILVVENDKNHLFLIEQELLSEGYNIILLQRMAAKL